MSKIASNNCNVPIYCMYSCYFIFTLEKISKKVGWIGSILVPKIVIGTL